MTMRLALVLALAVGGVSATAWADGGGKVDPKIDAKAEEKAVPVGENIVSPDAANKVDEDDLIKKLTGDDKSDAEAGPEKRFTEVLRRMGDSAGRLKTKDAGEVTQETQRRIVMDLDVLIDMARKSECKGGGSKQAKPGDKKTESKTAKKGSSSMGGTEAATNSELRDGAADANPNNKDIHDVNPEAWNALPPRDRDAITMGMKEEVLPGYRAMMEKYYEELAKTNKPR